MDAEPSVLRSGRRWRWGPPPAPGGEGGPPASDADGEAPGSPSPSAAAAASATAALFSCGVCLETARDPVVTLCGHLFCWPCIYRWVRRRRRRGSCPVCKSTVVVEPGEGTGVTPIYGIVGGCDGGGGGDGELSLEVPPRPRGLRRPRSTEGIWEDDASQGEALERFREGLRDLSREVDALEERMWRVMASVAQLRVPVLIAFAAEIARRNDAAAATSVVGRRRRRGDVSGTRSNSNDGGGDGVYRGTRSRRRQASL